MQAEHSEHNTPHFDIYLCIKLIIVYNTVKTIGKHPPVILMVQWLINYCLLHTNSEPSAFVCLKWHKHDIPKKHPQMSGSSLVSIHGLLRRI